MVLSTAVIGVGSVAASHTGTTVYVDASNSGTEDGSQANPFTTIQAGVNHASAGDRVLVASGTYAGSIIIGKPLTVESDGSAIIRSTGDAIGIRVDSQDVLIRGFTFDLYPRPIYVRSSSNVTIADNTFTNVYHFGILAEHSPELTIENNVIVGSGTGLYEGIRLYRTPRPVVSDNIIDGARVIGIHFIDADDGTITRNEIKNTGRYGTILRGSTGNTFSDNVFANVLNVYPRGENAQNVWNVSPQAGPNVAGGPQVGGNYWSNPTGTGFSDTATDADLDGFADTAYTDANVDDQHPLVSLPDDPPSLTASAGVTTYQVGATPVVVDPDVTATDSDGGDIDGARVVIQNTQPGDVLSFAAQHGITGGYDSSSGVLTLTGSATAIEYQDVFRSVTFSNTLATPGVVDRRITFALGASIPFDETGHYYRYVDLSTSGGINWQNANTTANSMTYYGLQGYLVTVTSQGENDFVGDKLQGDGWIGASDDTAFSFISKNANGNDRWYWVTGPEAGTHFWTGDVKESVNEPVAGQYANWAPNEPNDHFGADSENYAHFYHNSANWNDFPKSSGVAGFVVEYGGLASDPSLSLQDTKIVAVLVNTPPSIDVDAASVAFDEGSTASNAGTVSDAENDPLTLTASVGSVVDNGDGTWNWSFDTTDGPEDSQTVTITATDDDAASSTVTFNLTVSNVAPSVSADSASAAVDEGQTATNTGTFADPGDDVVTVTASAGTVSQASDGTWSWSFDAIDGPTDSQSVTVTATDSDGAATQTVFQLTVSNVAPELTADVDDSGVAGSPVSASGSFTDAGIQDTHAVAIDWGDGTSTAAAVTQAAGSGSFVDAHTYATGGSYDVTVTVSDDDGGLDSYSETITVAHLATVDVKPDSTVNPVNTKARGVLPVAILNTGDFDLTQVDASTLRLTATEGGAGAATAHNGHFEDVDDDGDLDLLLHFVNQDIGLTDDTTTVYLSGNMMDGVPIVGTDTVDPTPVGTDDDDAGSSGNGNGNGRGN